MQAKDFRNRQKKRAIQAKVQDSHRLTQKRVPIVQRLEFGNVHRGGAGEGEREGSGSPDDGAPAQETGERGRGSQGRQAQDGATNRILGEPDPIERGLAE